METSLPEGSLRRAFSPRYAYTWTYRNILSPFWEKTLRGRSTHELLAFLERS
ncbi:hypothetical protein [Sorangium sp. So ce131]|uniref:hypothetical protein n=1 Tax=Sorangium sp. So ce131 TaxID=3133282 RepID=UPI003F5FD524